MSIPACSCCPRITTVAYYDPYDVAYDVQALLIISQFVLLAIDHVCAYCIHLVIHVFSSGHWASWALWIPLWLPGAGHREGWPFRVNLPSPRVLPGWPVNLSKNDSLYISSLSPLAPYSFFYPFKRPSTSLSLCTCTGTHLHAALVALFGCCTVFVSQSTSPFSTKLFLLSISVSVFFWQHR